MTKQVVVFGTAVMTTLLAVVVLWQFRIVVVYVFISLALAAAVRPLARRQARRHFLVRVVRILLYLVALGSFAYLLFFTVQTAINEIQYMAQTVSEQDEWKLPVWLDRSSFQNAFLVRLPPPSLLIEAITGDQGQLVLPAILGVTQGITRLLSGGFIILFLSIYWSINQIHFERLWLSLLPSEQREQARGIWRAVEADLGAYISSQFIHSLVAGLILGLGYWLLGSPYPALLALIGALICLIPVVGVVLAVIPPLLVGLLTSVQLALISTLFTLVVLIVLKVWFRPWLFKRSWENPILTLILLIALADVFGLVGIIVAPPISVICQILWSRLVNHRTVARAAAKVSDLKERQARVRESIKTMDELPPALVTSSMERLTDLIEKAEPVLQAALLADPLEPFQSPSQITIEGESPGSIKS